MIPNMNPVHAKRMKQREARELTQQAQGNKDALALFRAAKLWAELGCTMTADVCLRVIAVWQDEEVKRQRGQNG